MSLKAITAQGKIAAMRKPIRVIQGGTSAGKTYSILPLLISFAAANEKKVISVVAESRPHLNKGAIRDFKDIMQMTSNWRREAWNATSATYTFANDTIIEFFGADRGDKLRGARRDILFVNEANNITFNAYQQLSIRTRALIFVDFNPSHEFWAHTELSTDEDAEWLTLTYKDNEQTPERVVNELVKAERKAEYSSFWKNWVDVYVYGKLGILQGVVFDDWSQADSIPEAAKLTGYGLDYGYTNDPTALVARYVYKGERYYHTVIYQRGLQPAELVKLMKQRKVSRTAPIIADNDPQQNDFLYQSGFKNVKGAKKRTIMFGIGILQKDHFYVTKASTEHIQELRKYTYEKDKEGKQINEPIDAFNHAIDAKRYIEVYLSAKRQGQSRTSQGRTPRHISKRM